MNISKSKFLLLCTPFLFAFTVLTNVAVRDYLNIGTSVTFNKKDYNLVWSSNPTENYYKQEYLPNGSSLNNYHDMIILEAIKGNISVEDAANIKVQEVQELQE